MSRPIFILLLGASIAAAIGQLLLRIGARDRIGLLAFINPYVITGLVFFAAGTVAWIYALSKAQMVTVYAFTALTFVLVYGGGVFLLGEQLTYWKSVGVALVIFGLFFVANG